MTDSLIFVSCGQATAAEKQLGHQIKITVDATPGFRAYFAEFAQDLEALTRHVFDAISGCAGAVVILQNRGMVQRSDGSWWGPRSSVWVNQEVAILAYRQACEAATIPILAFKDPEVQLEGAMTSLIVNPKPLSDSQQVEAAVRGWLNGTQFGGSSNDAFEEKWTHLSDDDKRVLVALIDQGGEAVKEKAVLQALRRLYGWDDSFGFKALSGSLARLASSGLVKRAENFFDGHEVSLHTTWLQPLRRRVAEWRKEQTPTA